MSDSGTKSNAKNKDKVHEPRKFKVIIFNDDFTPYDFVVNILKSIFKKDTESAIAVTTQVHSSGSGIAGVYSRDIAETKVDRAISTAQAAGHPLMIEAVPE